MIPAAAQTLAGILTQDSALIKAEMIDFGHPQSQQVDRPVLSLYCYHLELRSPDVKPDPALMAGLPAAIANDSAEVTPVLELASTPSPWVDLFFLISALDHTALGAQQLLSEALMRLLAYPQPSPSPLDHRVVGQASRPLQIAAEDIKDPVALWTALGVPLRPAIQVRVAVPFGGRPWSLAAIAPLSSKAFTPALVEHSGPGPPRQQIEVRPAGSPNG